MTAVFPLAGATNVPLTLPLVVQFPAPVISSTVRFSTLPAMELTVEWRALGPAGEALEGPARAVLFHRPLAPKANYILKLMEGSAADGRPIQPAQWPFRAGPRQIALPLLLRP